VEEMEEIPKSDYVEAQPSPKKARFAFSDDEDTAGHPELLPESEEDEPHITDAVSSKSLAKQTNFTQLLEKKPKDRRNGSTTYRVADTSCIIFPPKADLTTRMTKETWMHNRPGKGSSKKRVSWNGDFMKGQKREEEWVRKKRRYQPDKEKSKAGRLKE
jgi:hypothetical protein